MHLTRTLEYLNVSELSRQVMSYSSVTDLEKLNKFPYTLSSLPPLQNKKQRLKMCLIIKNMQCFYNSKIKDVLQISWKELLVLVCLVEVGNKLEKLHVIE